MKPPPVIVMRLEAIRATAPRRREGLERAILHAGLHLHTSDGELWGVAVDQEAYAGLVRAYGVRQKRSRGVGDTLARFIRWASRGRIKPCCGCKKRQGWLNRVWPYRLTSA